MGCEISSLWRSAQFFPLGGDILSKEGLHSHNLTIGTCLRDRLSYDQFYYQKLNLGAFSYLSETVSVPSTVAHESHSANMAE